MKKTFNQLEEEFNALYGKSEGESGLTAMKEILESMSETEAYLKYASPLEVKTFKESLGNLRYSDLLKVKAALLDTVSSGKRREDQQRIADEMMRKNKHDKNNPYRADD